MLRRRCGALFVRLKDYFFLMCVARVCDVAKRAKGDHSRTTAVGALVPVLWRKHARYARYGAAQRAIG